MAFGNVGDILGSQLSGFTQGINFALFSKIGTNVLALLGAVDVFVQEEHDVTVGTTDYPIETGATQTDHTYVNPKTLQLRGYVSDAIMPEFTTVFGNARGAVAFSRIIRAIENRELTTVVTSKYTYQNMIIVGFNPTVDVDTGNSLIFDLNLKEQLIADTQSTQLPNRSGVAQNKAGNENTGESQSQPPTPSVADQIFNKLSGYLR